MSAPELARTAAPPAAVPATAVSEGEGEVVDVDPCRDERWHALAAGGEGSVFTSPPWLRALAATYGLVPRGRVLLADDGTPRAGWVSTRVDDLRGARVVSMPFSDWADPIGVDADPVTWALLSAGVLDGAVPVRLRCRDAAAPRADPRLEHGAEVAWHATTLHDGRAADPLAASSSLRRNLARSRELGVRVAAETGPEAVATYHRLHVERRRHRYRLLAQPIELLERLCDEFGPDGCVVLVARCDGDAVAGGVFLVWDGVLYYKFGASAADRLALRPNDALFAAAVAWAADRGLRRVDWGCSDLDQPGLIAFKRKWADLEGRISTLGRGAPSAPEADALLRELTALLTDPSVPAEVTTRGGALLYRYFC